MSKRKDPADAFGLSLMDVLSNALGGVILLVMIVAVTLRGNDRMRKNKPEEDRLGSEHTVIQFKRSSVVPEIEYNMLTVQVRFKGGSAVLNGAGSTNGISIAKVGDRQGQQGFQDWLISAENIKELTSKSVVSARVTGPPPDSVYVIATRAMNVVASFSERYEPSKAQELLVITKKEGNSAEILLQGKSTPN